MNHGTGSYVGMTQKKHGRPYIRIDRAFAENNIQGVVCIIMLRCCYGSSVLQSCDGLVNPRVNLTSLHPQSNIAAVFLCQSQR